MSQIVQDVPEDIRICEYECRKSQCTMAHATGCEMRRHAGAGDLLPLAEAIRRAGSIEGCSLPANPLTATDRDTVHI